MKQQSIHNILGAIAYGANVEKDEVKNNDEAIRIVEKILLPSISANDFTKKELIDALNTGITNHDWYVECFPTTTTPTDFAIFFKLIKNRLINCE
jgi:hypothetical protein